MKNGKIKAIIFDFDGLMVNTEELRFLAFYEFIKNHGKKFRKPDYIKTLLAKTAEQVTRFLKDTYKLEGSIEELTVERRKLFKDLFDKRLAFMDGVSELLERTKNWKVKRAIASGRNRADITEGLQRLGVLDLFDCIVTDEDLISSDGKPDPEIFLIAAQKLGVAPKDCLVLEDAPHGVEAAKAAGMRTVYVPDARFFESRHDGADVILKNLGELTDEILEELTLKWRTD